MTAVPEYARTMLNRYGVRIAALIVLLLGLTAWSAAAPVGKRARQRTVAISVMESYRVDGRAMKNAHCRAVPALVKALVGGTGLRVVSSKAKADVRISVYWTATAQSAVYMNGSSQYTGSDGSGAFAITIGGSKHVVQISGSQKPLGMVGMNRGESWTPRDAPFELAFSKAFVMPFCKAVSSYLHVDAVFPLMGLLKDATRSYRDGCLLSAGVPIYTEGLSEDGDDGRVPFIIKCFEEVGDRRVIPLLRLTIKKHADAVDSSALYELIDFLKSH